MTVSLRNQPCVIIDWRSAPQLHGALFNQVRIVRLPMVGRVIAGTLLMLLTLTLFSSVAHAEQRVALVVGNSAYQNSPLANPVNDARGVSEELKRHGFDVIELFDADRREMRNALRRFNNTIGRDSVALFYFAGHGMQVNGENYLLPVKASIEAEFEVPDEALGVSTVLRAMAASKSALNLVVLDACRDNPYSRRWRSGATRGLTRIENPPQSTLMFYSASPGEVAEDGRGENSPFTAAFLTELKQRPEQEISKLFIQTTRAVHQKTGGRQTPYVEGVLLRDFSFRGDAGEVRLNETEVSAARPDSENTERQALAVQQQREAAALALERESLLARARSAEASLSLTAGWRRGVQSGLNKAGFNVGVVDGLWGARTREGIRQWQASTGLPDTGYLNASDYQQLVAELGISEVEAARRRRQGFEPEMVRIEGGSFEMGTRKGNHTERPVRNVRVRGFEMGKYEVTFDQYDAYARATGVELPDDEGWGRGNRPVINVSWEDAQGYIRWLNAKTAGGYRLPSEAEWEYAARAGTTGSWSFAGDESEICRYGNSSTSQCNDGYVKTAPVGSYQANGNGLHDVHGNVLEWVEDCWHASYEGAPVTAQAWTQGEDCDHRLVRGGSWGSWPVLLRSANRVRFNSSLRFNVSGFRVSRTLTP